MIGLDNAGNGEDVFAVGLPQVSEIDDVLFREIVNGSASCRALTAEHDRSIGGCVLKA